MVNGAPNRFLNGYVFAYKLYDLFGKLWYYAIRVIS